MYDLDFIYEYAGFSSLPADIDRQRLFNVSFDVTSGAVKLYILDASERFAHKLSSDSSSKQYAGDDPEFGADPRRLNDFLGEHFEPWQLTIDAVEGDAYYIYTGDCQEADFMRFFNCLIRRFGIAEQRLLGKISAINNQRFNSLRKCYQQGAVMLVRVPLNGGECKLYAQPFLHGRQYTFNQQTLDFLLRLYACSEAELPTRLQHLWVATEMFTDRTLVVAQYHELLHAE